MRKFLTLLGAVLVLCLNSFAQTGKITGKVTDSRDGSPLSGATVRVKGGGATKTGPDGSFSLNAPGSGSTEVELSSVGYLSKTVRATPGESLNFTLDTDPKSLSEVVVTGTGVATSKKKLGISVESVTASQLPQAPSASIDQALVGKIAGAQIQSGSGNPGDPVNITLRGINTIQNGTKPLILLDGVEIRSTDLQSLDLTNIERVEVVQGAASATIYGAQGANGVIQLFSKRGKRGSVAINFSSSFATTDFLNVGNVHKADLHPYLTDANGELVDKYGVKLYYDQQYAGLLSGKYQVRGIAYQYGKYNPATNTYRSGDYRYGILDGKNNINNKPYIGDIHYYDHFKQVFQTGSVMNNSLSLSGGGDKSDYAISISNNHSITPVMRNGYLDRTNVTANIGMELFKGFKIRSTTQLVYTKNTMHTGLGGGGGYGFGRGGSGNVGRVYGFLNTSPFLDLTAKDKDGNYGFYLAQNFLSVNSSNPYYDLQYNSSIDNKVDVVQSFDATYRINKFIELDGKYGINYRNESARWIFYNQSENALGNYYNSWDGAFNGNDLTGDISNWQYNNTFQNAIVSAFLRFDLEKDFHVKVPLQSSTQVSYDYRKNKYTEFDNYGITLPLNPPFNFSATATQAIANDYVEPFITFGYLVNQKFDFSDWAGVTAGFRSDYSSAFGAGSKPATFPHADGYLTFSGMPFWKGGLENAIPYFKVRGAYGEAGIQPGAFDRYPVINTGNLGNGLTYSIAGTAKNPNLKVEVSKETEFGGDLTVNLNKNGSIFKSATLSATYWQRKSENVIYALGTPPSTGVTNVLNNAIDMSSKGWQFNLQIPIVQSRNFNWDLTTLYGTQRSRIDHIAGDAEIPLGSAAGSTSLVLKGGRDIGQIYAFQTFRDFNKTQPDGTPYIDPAKVGQYQMVYNPYFRGMLVVDTVTRGIMFTNVQAPIGNATPKFMMSFINGLSWKNFISFNFQFDWIAGAHMYNQTKEWMFRDGISGEFTRPVDFGEHGGFNAYTAHWASAYYGLWGSTRGIGNNTTKDFFWEDASFVRLRNISLGFDFTRYLNIRAVKKLQLVLSGRNIATWTKYSGFDPEISSGAVNSSYDRGIDHSTLPNTKSYQVSLNLGF